MIAILRSIELSRSRPGVATGGDGFRKRRLRLNAFLLAVLVLLTSSEVTALAPAPVRVDGAITASAANPGTPAKGQPHSSGGVAGRGTPVPGPSSAAGGGANSRTGQGSSIKPSAPPAKRQSVAIPEETGVQVALENGRTLVLRVDATAKATLDTLADRFLDPEMPTSVLESADTGSGASHGRGRFRIPVTLLSPAWREKALRAAFPQDGPSQRGWVHRPSGSALDTYGEGAWEVALWFTGDGKKFKAILELNGLSDPILVPGAEVTVPGPLLLDPFRQRWEDQRKFKNQTARATGEGEADAAKETAGEPPSTESEPGSKLVFSKDDEGDYAAYHLMPGEALYSSVVVRFTGRLDPEDVTEAAETIARRSGIRDTSNIPVGYEVKIPRSMLLPEFLPLQDRRRKAVERVRKETDKVKNPVRSRNLAGIHVILDAGHGGVDPGALIAGIAEHEYAYDVMCRVKRILEAETGAVVHPTIEDPASGFGPRSTRVLSVGGRETILTTPAHLNGSPDETSLGVNLRWYLANSIQRHLIASSVDRSRIVFASFHADVLHASLRGAMVYVPGEQYRRGTYTCGDQDCSRYGEVREAPAVRFTKSDRLASEGLSREFAADLIQAFRKRGIRVHPFGPVRDRVIRGGRAWLPAVLRGNQVPVKVLVEMANLNNAADRALILDPEFRESLARGFSEALLRYYKSPPAPAVPKSRVADRRPTP